MNSKSTEKKERPIEELLEAHRTPLWKRTLVWGAVAVVVAGGAWLLFSGDSVEKTEYVTVKAVREPIDVSVTADGTLKPTRTVSLGSQLSGIVERVNVDVNDHVKKGQVLIELDPRNLRARVANAEAELESARARELEAKAKLNEARTKLNRYEELRRTSNGRLPSALEMDAQKALVKTAGATLSVARASIQSAKASLDMARTDLGKTLIRSPIDGVVLKRSVEPGYAVAASLQAVELLELASDLSELELEVAVDEADIGVVKPGQPSYFTVSSYPNERFKADLTKVAFGATRNGNVVTYTAYLTVNNKDKLLRPGMTASTTIATGHEDDALVVPNSAFRYEPPAQKTGQAKVKIKAGPPHRTEVQMHKKDVVVHGETVRTLYVMRGGVPERVRVTTGLNNGVESAVLTGDLKAGDEVVIDQKKKGSAK